MAEDSTPKRPIPSTEALHRANAKLRSAGFGNLGDSVERRYTGYNDMLGGGNDYFAGMTGSSSTFSALGPGMFYGAGLGYGDWSYGRGYGPYGMGGQSGPFTYLRRFSGTAAVAHQIIARCTLAYLTYGIIKNIIDLYADFASEGLEIVHEDSSVQNFYQVWARRIDLNGRLNRFFTDYFLTGNVFVYRVNATLTDKDKADMKRGKSYQIVNGEIILDRPGSLKSRIIRPKIEIDPMLLKIPELKSVVDSIIAKAQGGRVTSIVRDKPPSEFDTPDNPDKVIPWDYISLNPLQLEPRGKKFKGERSWAFALDKDDAKDMMDFISYRYYQDLGRTEVNLPGDFKGTISKYQGTTPGYSAEISLDAQRLSLIQDKKFDYWDWSVPLVWPALRAIAFKDVLLGMDMRVASSMINTVTLWKLGDDKNNTYPEEEAFERLADMLQQPGQAVNLIWNKDISAEVIQANIAGLFDEKKYDAANRDILQALGITEVLVGGKGSNFSNSYISVATILQKLESARQKFEHWLMRELKIISDAMGFRKLPKIRWGKNSLTDHKSEQTLIIQLFDRGVVSAETALRYFNEDIDIEVERQIQEKKIAEKEGIGVLEKRTPYSRPEESVKVGVTPPNWKGALSPNGPEGQTTHTVDPKKLPPSMQAKPQAPGTPNIQKGPNGRPPGAKDATKRPQKTVKPKGRNIADDLLNYAQIVDSGNRILGQLEEVVTNNLLQARELKYFKQLNASDKHALDNLIYVTFSNLTPDFIVTEESVAELMKTEAPAKLDRCVKEVLAQRTNKFKQDNGREPNKEEKRALLSSAWGICKSSVNLTK